MILGIKLCIRSQAWTASTETGLHLGNRTVHPQQVLELRLILFASLSYKTRRKKWTILLSIFSGLHQI